MNIEEVINNIKQHNDKSFKWIFNEIVRDDIYRLSNLKTPATIIDIGANIGMFSILASLKFPEAKIYSYEPQKDVFDILKYNIKEYPNIKAYNIAFGDGSDLYFHHRKGASCLGHMFLKGSKIKTTKGYKVKSVSIADIVKKHDIDLSKETYLKMDCEGGETYLETEENILTCMKISHIGLEVHTCPPFNVKLKDWLQVMADTHKIKKITNKKTANVFSLLKR